MFIKIYFCVSIKLSTKSFRSLVMEFLASKMQTPKMFGWFHLLAWGIVIGLCVFLALIRKSDNEKRSRIVLLTFSIAAILLEVYKQVLFTYIDDWNYQWYAFPFQFCSTPLYVALIAGLVKEGKFRDSLMSFLGTFGLFAGLAVMVFPGDVFVKYVGINIQTMVVHGGMVVVGFYCIISKRSKPTIKNFFMGALVFVCLATIADLMNIIVYNSGVLKGQTFNMFYISPYFDCTLLVLKDFYFLPYPVFLLVYVAGFTLAGFLMFLPGYVVDKILTHKANKLGTNYDAKNNTSVAETKNESANMADKTTK